MADPTAQDITGTLGPGLDVNGLIQAMIQQQAQQEQALASRTAQANQAAQQAQGAYQAAATAPPEQINPLALLAPALLGNVASVISQNPNYSQRGQQTIQLTREQMAQRRKENLQQLRDVFEQRAQEAQDLESQQKLRGRISTIDSALEKLTKHTPTRSTADVLTNMTDEEYARFLKRKREVAEATRTPPRPRGAGNPPKPKKPPGKPTTAEEAAALIEMAKTPGDVLKASRYLKNNPFWEQHPAVKTAIQDAKKRLGGGG